MLKVQNCFLQSISVINSNKMLLISARGVWGALQALPQWGLGWRPGSQSLFRFYIALNASKAVRNIIWLINL